MKEDQLVNTSDMVTLILAGYGAVVSTILGIRELQRDRRRISVILEYVVWCERAQITITNVGHRPITVTEIGMEVEGERVPRNALFAPEVEREPLPVTLGDGEYITLPLSGVIGEIFRKTGMPARVSVYDVEGNVYKRFRTRVYDPKWGHYSKISS